MAVYPAGLPTTTAAGATLATPAHSGLHDDVSDEVVAVCTELGLTPSGTISSTVRARLDKMGLGLIYEGSLSQTFSASEGPTDLDIDTEVYDPLSMSTTGSGTFTATTRGLYAVVFTALRSSGSGTVTATLEVTTGETAPLLSGSVASSVRLQRSQTYFMEASDVWTFSGTEDVASSATIECRVLIYHLGSG